MDIEHSQGEAGKPIGHVTVSQVLVSMKVLMTAPLYSQ